MARGGTGGGGGGGGDAPGEDVPGGEGPAGGLPEGVMYADIPGMRAAASTFDQVAAFGRSIYEEFKNATAAIGECWGTDETGDGFYKSYGDSYTNAIQGTWEIADGFTKIGENIREWASSYEQLEADADAAAAQFARGSSEAAGWPIRTGGNSAQDDEDEDKVWAKGR